MVINVSAQRLVRYLVWGVLILSILNIGLLLLRFFTGHSRLLGLGKMFNMGLEANVPTWFSSTILLICSVLLWIISRAVKMRRDRHAVCWKILSIVFLYMSIDETATIHEVGADVLARVLGSSTLAGYGGVIPNSVLVLVVILVSLPLIRSLPNYIRRLFLTAGVLYVGGAAGIEAMERKWDLLHGVDNFGYGLMIALEEPMEMIGIMVFIYALISYYSLYHSNLELKFTVHKAQDMLV